jgi:hypothetical protein
VLCDLYKAIKYVSTQKYLKMSMVLQHAHTLDSL